jgi:hypothetical protein
MPGKNNEIVEFESIWERAQKVDSPHLPKEHAKILYEISQKAPGNCVEIGSWIGRSTAIIGSAVKNSGNCLFSVDHWNKVLDGIVQGEIDLWDRWNQTVTEWELEEFVIPFRGVSCQIAQVWDFKRHPIGFLFIDGEHSYLETGLLLFPQKLKKEFGYTHWKVEGKEIPLEDYAPVYPRGAKLDYDVWAVNIIPEGYLIMHDVNRPEHPGSSRVWMEEVLNSNLWTVIIDGDGLGLARKNY